MRERRELALAVIQQGRVTYLLTVGRSVASHHKVARLIIPRRGMSPRLFLLLLRCVGLPDYATSGLRGLFENARQGATVVERGHDLFSLDGEPSAGDYRGFSRCSPRLLPSQVPIALYDSYVFIISLTPTVPRSGSFSFLRHTLLDRDRL